MWAPNSIRAVANSSMWAVLHARRTSEGVEFMKALVITTIGSSAFRPATPTLAKR